NFLLLLCVRLVRPSCEAPPQRQGQLRYGMKPGTVPEPMRFLLTPTPMRDRRRIVMSNSDGKPKQQNEGEGSRSAARAYNKDQQEFVKEGRVDEAAQAARKAVEGDRAELDKAEKEGKSHIAERDPAEVRDDTKPA